MRVISKSLNILDYALSLLVRQKLKNLGVFIVFTAVIFLLASFQLFSTALKESAARILTTVPHITVQKMSAGRQIPYNVDYDELLRGIFGIATVKERVWGYYFDEKNGANYTVVGLDQHHISPRLAEVLSWGGLPQRRGDVVIAEPVQESMQLGSRERFSLFRPDLTMKSFKVVGRFSRGSSLVTDDILLMTRQDAADLFAMDQSFITDLLVDVANPTEIDTIAAKISARLPGARVITQNQIHKTYNVVFSWRSGFGSICLLTSLFAFIILSWDKASGMSPEERREMAILKVTGWQTSDIMWLRFCESSVIAFTAFVGGYSLAWLHIVFFDGVLLRPVLLGWSVIRPSFQLAPPFVLHDFLLIAAFSIIPYMVATIVPAWKSAMVRPDSVM
ncbi:MAG: FtsX-like permease family protein [Desulfopila sp.]|jgi:ABC-type lipoprotein release transport system permease subunit|nr:FtsX-like permease family protein [Desulfopila sp.]